MQAENDSNSRDPPPAYFCSPNLQQGGITCGAIDEPRKSSKAIDKRVIINFCDKNVIIARFRNKDLECLYIYYSVIEE